MVWMQNFMKRTNSRRRQHSQSPSSSDSVSRSPRRFFSSKHKRRFMTRGDDPAGGLLTDSTASTAHGSDFCPWRVENVRRAAPTSDEWWEEVSGAVDSDEDDDGIESMIAKRFNATNPSKQMMKRFHNCGLETWLKTRKEWNRRTVETLPPKPTPAEFDVLVKGLKKHITQRHYELPRRMCLTDLIEVYTDIWDDGRG